MGIYPVHSKLAVIEPKERNLTDFYSGPPQRWGLGLGGGLEYYNDYDSLREGKLRIFSYPRVEFKTNPFSWESFAEEDFTDTGFFYLHSLKWVDTLLIEASKGNDAAASFAAEVVSDWSAQNKKNIDSWKQNEHVWDGHTVALRTTTLVALSEFRPTEEWLFDDIKNHVETLKSEFDGFWNHGLVQSLALAGASCRVGDAAGLSLGLERISGCFAEMIDDEGCINEQAPEYARYIERILRTTIEFYKLNQIEGIEPLLHKKELIREFIAHSLQPNGEFVELGDSSRRRPNLMQNSPIEYVFSNGTQGTAIPNHKIYNQGFVFGRSGFGNYRHIDLETYYSLRFGPARIIHGHNDHFSLTYWAKGRRAVVDPGHVGYTPGFARNYVRKHESHNTLVVVGEKHDWSANTELVEAQTSDHWQSYSLEDRGYSQVPRRRSVCFTDCGPFALLDTAVPDSGVKHFSQRWNISPEFSLSQINNEAVIFTSNSDGTKLILLNFNILSVDNFSASSVEVHHGDQSNERGLIAQKESLVDTYNIGFSARSSDLRMLTAVFLAEADEETGWSFRKFNEEAGILRIHVGKTSWAFNVNLTEKKVWGRVVNPPQSWGNTGLVRK